MFSELKSMFARNKLMFISSTIPRRENVVILQTMAKKSSKSPLILREHFITQCVKFTQSKHQGFRVVYSRNF
jgi:hypothetical protein